MFRAPPLPTPLTLFTLFALLTVNGGCRHNPPVPPQPFPQPVPLAGHAGEIRGVWIADPRGANWERIANDLAAMRINTAFVKFSTGGASYYPSRVLPMSGLRRDEAQRCIAAMHRRGISVHAWHVNLQMKDAPRAEISRAIAENRVQRDRSGTVLYPSYRGVAILCPSYPPNRALEARAMVELARLGVDGVQLDHIRFADGDSCYCANCRVGFERFVGRRVVWPREATPNGTLRQQFLAYRQSVITQLVYEIRRELVANGCRVPLSAAVFPDLQNARIERGQDWKTWVDVGYLDMLCPMNYQTSTGVFERRLRSELDAVSGRMPVIVGIGAFLDGVTSGEMRDQIAAARRIGARGYVIFSYEDRDKMLASQR